MIKNKFPDENFCWTRIIMLGFFLIIVQKTFVSMIHSQINCLRASMFILYNRNILKLDNLLLIII